jgi:fused signal recognition particle receptor
MSEQKKGFFRNMFDRVTGAVSIPVEEETPQQGQEVEAEQPSEKQQGPPSARQEEQATVQPSAPQPEPVKPAELIVTPVEEPAEKPGFFNRLKAGLKKTTDGLVGRIDALVLGKKEIDADTLEELEEILITSDIGVKTTMELVRNLEQRLSRNELKDGAALRNALKEELLKRLKVHHFALDTSKARPFTILVVGVNGVGKTTTIGKLAARYTAEGKKVLLAAADTFRAAAAEQLEVWGERAGVQVVRHKEGADPSAVAFDACKAAVSRGADILIIDTAGRLHTKINLMEEMKKIHRVIGREIPGAPHETLLILDGATGQNALSQARLFKESAAVTGLVLTKLDGTAKGGIVVAVSHEYSLPVRFIGVGEGADDLREFDPQEFVDALFQTR